jgi:hypothetical protein
MIEFILVLSMYQLLYNIEPFAKIMRLIKIVSSAGIAAIIVNVIMRRKRLQRLLAISGKDRHVLITGAR